MKKSHNISVNSVNEAFIKLAKGIFNDPDYVISPRNIETKEWINVQVKIKNPYNRLVTNVHRNMSLKYAFGEWLWYLSASESVKPIAYYSKYWNKLSDDLITANSAYGARIYGKSLRQSIDQWSNVKNELIKDNSSRRAVIQIDMPADLIKDTKDMPCTLSLHFLIRENKLNLVVNMRSNDLVLGFPYDTFSFTLFQELMLVELKEFMPQLKMGTYFHNVSSMHIYAKDYDLIKAVLTEPRLNSSNKMPKIKNINELGNLLHNEEIIRNGTNETLIKLRDKFCKFAQEKINE
jgi:thymidylate synthase